MKRTCAERPGGLARTDWQQDHIEAGPATVEASALDESAHGAPQPVPFPGAFAFQHMPVMLSAQGIPGAVDTKTAGGKTAAGNMSALLAALTSGDFGHAHELVLAVDPGIVYCPPLEHEPALVYAVRFAHPGIVDAVLHAIPAATLQRRPDAGNALILAAALGNIAILKRLLAQPGIDPDFMNDYGDTALIVTAGHGGADAVDCLIEAGAQVNLPNAEDGWTALASAVEQGKVDIVKRLLTHARIDPDLFNKDGDSALMLAARANELELVDCLLRSGARPGLANDKNGMTALMYAACNSDVDVVQRLLACPGIDHGHLDAEGHGALAHAVLECRPEVVDCLLGAGVCAGLPGSRRGSTLDLVVRTRQLPIIEVFIRHGKLPQAVIAAFTAGTTLFAAIVADLCAEQEAAAFVLPDHEHGLAFFRQLVASLDEDRIGRRMLACLHEKNLRTACAHEVLDALTATRSPMCRHGFTQMQKLTYSLSVISRLAKLGAPGRILAQYRRAEITAAASERLAQAAGAQVAELVELATQVLASVGGEMMNGLVDTCVSRTGMDLQVDVAGLQRCLVDEGLLAPIAQAVPTSWQAAATAVLDHPIAMPAGNTVRQAGASMRAHYIERTPDLFAMNIRRQLAAHPLLSQLDALMVDGDDEGIHAQFQIQCDQLRQYCAQVLAQEQPQTT